MAYYYADGYVLDENLRNKLLEENKIFKCEYCNEYHIIEETPVINCENSKMCLTQYCNNYSVCGCCGKDVRKGRLQQGLCQECYNKLNTKRVHNYSYQPVMRFYKDDSFDTRPSEDYDGFGIELEVDGCGENCYASSNTQTNLNDEVYIKHDGSLRSGFEIVTYPHTENSFYKMNWKETLSELVKSGYRSHDVGTCGLHMHCSRTNLDKNALIRLVYFYEKFRKDVLKFSRRDSEHANRWAASYFSAERYVNLESCERVVERHNKSHCHEDRYHCVNLINENTVEIRIMRGTLNYDTFMATNNFLMTIFKNCRKDFDVDNLDKWLEGIDDNTKNYMKKRKCFGYSNNSRSNEECDLNVHNCV